MGFCVSKERRLVPPIANPISAQEAIASSVLIGSESHADIQKVYTYKKVLGHGQFGTVREAEMIRGQRHVAIKSILKAKVKKDFHLLRRELEVMRHIDHPNVIKYFETYEDEKYLHIVMELCTGGDLLDRILREGSISEPRAAGMMRSLMVAVNYLHGVGICHRDLKPENFLFESPARDSLIKLIDFGMAVKQLEISEMSSFVGTPYYIAPEVLKGKYGYQCDVWSLGVVLYLLLCGFHPFDGEDIRTIFRSIRKDPVNFDDTAWDGISNTAKDLITQMLIKNPQQRISLTQAMNHRWFFDQGQQSPRVVSRNVLKSVRRHKPKSKLQKEVMRVMIKFLSAADIEELRCAFLEIDQGNTGFITASDMEKAMENAGLAMQAEEVKSTSHIEIVYSIEGASEGKIKYSDFLVATLDRKNLQDEELLFLTFQHFDADSDGFINVADLKIALENMGDFSDHDELEAMIADWDLDNNRQIDFPEFKRMMSEAKENSEHLSAFSRSSSKYARSMHKTLARLATPCEE